MLKRSFLFFLILSLILLLDQSTKIAAHALLSLGESKEFIPGLLNFSLAFNPGIAFSFLNSGSLPMVIVLTALAIGISILLFFWFLKPEESALTRLGYVFIAGGALGNAIDRIRLGKVIDFLDVYWQNWHWPTFNIADSFIVIGVIALIGSAFFAKQKKTTQQSSSQSVEK